MCGGTYFIDVSWITDCVFITPTSSTVRAFDIDRLCWHLDQSFNYKLQLRLL